MFLAQGLLWGCSQGVGWGCTIWRLDWAGGSTSKMLSCATIKDASVPHWPLMKSLSFLSCGPLHRLLEYPHNTAAGFPQFKWFKKWANVRTTVSFISWPWKSQIVFSTISYWLHRWVPFNIEVNYTRTWKPGSGNPCGPSWKLATTVR